MYFSVFQIIAKNTKGNIQTLKHNILLIQDKHSQTKGITKSINYYETTATHIDTAQPSRTEEIPVSSISTSDKDKVMHTTEENKHSIVTDGFEHTTFFTQYYGEITTTDTHKFQRHSRKHTTRMGKYTKSPHPKHTRKHKPNTDIHPPIFSMTSFTDQCRKDNKCAVRIAYFGYISMRKCRDMTRSYDKQALTSMVGHPTHN